MIQIRIQVRSDGADTDITEEETVVNMSEPEPVRVARIMRSGLGKVERALGFTTDTGIDIDSVPAELLAEIQQVFVPPQMPDLPAPTETADGVPTWVGGTCDDEHAYLVRRIPPNPALHRDTTVYLSTSTGQRTIAEARAFALAILAATEQTDGTN